MNIVINGTNLALKFSNRSKVVASKTGILNTTVNFVNPDKVLDEERGYLYYDYNSLSWVFCGLNQINPNKQIGKLVLVLESPHISEYSKTRKPLRPANGRAGTGINQCLGKKITTNPPAKICKETIYKVYVVNSIQFQTSCFNTLNSYTDYNENWHTIRNNVFKALWLQGNLMNDFQQRIRLLKPDIIINCVTGGKSKNSLKCLVENAVKSDHQYSHPSVWR